MQFYHEIITEKSFQFLQELKMEYEFVLIGGWAVFLYSHSLKSKDIDIIVDYSELAKLKKNFDVFKNDRLKKYELKKGGFDVDIYLPHYSDLGIDVEVIRKNIANKDGFDVPKKEILFLLKLYAWQARKSSLKGRKDELDIFSLAFLPDFGWEKYMKFAESLEFSEYNNCFRDLLKKTRRIEELEINEQKMARERKKILKYIE